MSTSTEIERLSGWFTADSIEDAVCKAREWAEAESNIDCYEILSIEAINGTPRRDLWNVTWNRAFKSVT